MHHHHHHHYIIGMVLQGYQVYQLHYVYDSSFTSLTDCANIYSNRATLFKHSWLAEEMNYKIND